jgi:predicted O-methyltransferase YrrM
MTVANMVVDPKTYFSNLLPGRDPLLNALELEAARESIPIAGPAVGELLFILACLSGARRILELGTATGYSAIYLARACRQNNGSLTTVESNPAMARRAEKNLMDAGLADISQVRVGAALELMQAMDLEFDLIFMDIEKKDYLPALPHCHRLLRGGGLMVADNIAFQEADPFNRAVAFDKGWRSIPLYAFLPGHSPEHDGLCLALRG